MSNTIISKCDDVNKETLDNLNCTRNNYLANIDAKDMNED